MWVNAPFDCSFFKENFTHRNEMEEKIIEEKEEEFKAKLEAFISSQERIFNLLDRLSTDYLRGRNVKKELKSFRGMNEQVYDLLQELFTNEEEVKNKLEKIEISKEKKKIYSLLKIVLANLLILSLLFFLRNYLDWKIL